MTVYPADLEAFIIQQDRVRAKVEDKASGVDNHAATVIPASRQVSVPNNQITRIWSKGSE